MIHTLKDLINRSFDAHAARPALRTLQGSRANLRYEPITYGELKLQRDCLAVGLSGIGLSHGQRVGILTDRPLEPLLLFLACDCLGLSADPYARSRRLSCSPTSSPTRAWKFWWWTPELSFRWRA